MKILHVCLAAFYIDNYAYQENLLPKYHKKMGHDVEIVASLQTFDQNGIASYLDKPGKYINEHQIKVTRLNYKRGLLNKKLKRYLKLEVVLNEFSPDVMFIHGIQFLDILKLFKYKKHHNVVLVADNHADFTNSGTNFFSKYLLHKGLWRFIAKKSVSHIRHFFGVLPKRVDFLTDVYKIPSDKVSLLLMGVDDEIAHKSDSINHKKWLLDTYHINNNKILLMAGGKFDSSKKDILVLVEAMKELKEFHLLIFGPFDEKIKLRFDALRIKLDNVSYVPWLDASQGIQHLMGADIVVFPGRHSVYWEQAAGLGKPLIVKKSYNTDYINIDGNAFNINTSNPKNIIDVLIPLKEKNELEFFTRNAQKVASNFYYSEIAKKSLEKIKLL